MAGECLLVIVMRTSTSGRTLWRCSLGGSGEWRYTNGPLLQQEDNYLYTILATTFDKSVWFIATQSLHEKFSQWVFRHQSFVDVAVFIILVTVR